MTVGLRRVMSVADQMASSVFVEEAVRALLALTLTLVLLLFAVRSYFGYKFSYWKRRGMSGPPPSIPFGNALRQHTGAWHNVELDRIRKYGKVFGVYDGTSPGLLCVDPEILERVLVKDFNTFTDRQTVFHKSQRESLIASNGAKWKMLRSIISPSFTTGKIKAMHDLMKVCIGKLTAKIEDEIKEQGGPAEFKILETFSKMTLDVIAAGGFGLTIDPYRDPNDPFIRNAIKVFEFRRWPLLLATILPQRVSEFLSLSSNPPDAWNYLVQNSTRLMHQRRAAKKRDDEFVDVLQLLIDAESVNPDGSKNKLTDAEIVASATNVLAAGYVTTRLLLLYSAYHLAIDDKIQSRLRQEVEEAVAADGGEVTYETVMTLPYMEAFVNEALRMYPPVARAERRGVTDYEIKKIGLKLEKGVPIHVPIMAMHHMEEYWPNSFQFDPERFMGENKDKITPCTFIPFLTGPRNCIGFRFALLEVKTAIALWLMKFNLLRAPDTDVPIDISSATIAMTPKETVIRFSLRK